METLPKVKILIGYHKPAVLFKSKILVPVQGGRACDKEISKDGRLDPLDIRWLHNNTLGDDTGENLSVYNRYINEMTVIYWAWKNYDKLGNPDYIGFMQYAKHLILNPYMEIARQPWSVVGEAYRYSPQQYLASGNLSDENIYQAIKDGDIVCAQKADVKPAGASTCKEQLDVFSEGRAEQLLAILKDVVSKKWPTLMPYVKELEEDSLAYMTNLFIMKKEIFFEYCTFMFAVLKQALDKLDLKDCSAVQKRAPGFLGEFVTSVFLRSCEEKYKIKTCKTAVLSEPDKEDVIADAIMLGCLKRRWFAYRLLTHMSWGQTHKRYQKKKQLFAQRVQRAKAYLNIH